MKRIALLRRENSSAWPSCAIIVPNLEAAYRLLAKEFHLETFFIPTDEKPTQLTQVLRDLQSFKPDDIVILDHEPFGTWALNLLKRRGNLSRETRIIVHGFGDFSLSAIHWCELQSWLKEFRVAFVGASHRSMQLFGRLISNPVGRIFLAAFPVDTEFFHAKHRTNINPLRESLSIQEDELVLLYSGRLSLQKNITSLIECVNDASINSERRLRLVLAGGFDDIGAELFQVTLPDGFYSARVSECISKTETNPKLKIDLLGNLGREDLRNAYFLSDLLVSLSLQHDEDFGMSPAESLCCGTPAAISNWGGFASFKEYVKGYDDRYCQLVSVNIDTGVPTFEINQMISAIHSWSRRPITKDERLQLGNHAHHHLSYGGVGHNLRVLLNSEFPDFDGFSPLMWRTARKGIYGRFIERDRVDVELYKGLYSAYAGGVEA